MSGRQSRRTRWRFEGAIAGVGTTGGVRVVIGRWDRSPLGRFADVMLAEPDGTRVLLAPSEEVADFVSTTYTFDRVEIGPVEVTGDAAWTVRAPGLRLALVVGPRPLLGRLLRLVPHRVATSPAWTALTDPVARVVLPGVRTRGTTGSSPPRREYYGATDLHTVTTVSGTWRDRDLGTLASVSPEPGFGFGSTPRRPGVTHLVSTVEVPEADRPTAARA